MLMTSTSIATHSLLDCAHLTSDSSYKTIKARGYTDIEFALSSVNFSNRKAVG